MRWHDLGMMGLRARFFGPGEVRLALLSLMSETPMHGYELMKRLEERSGGVYRASAGTVYPTLQQLEDEGLVTSESREGKRVYSLTEAGRAVMATIVEGLRARDCTVIEADTDGAYFVAPDGRADAIVTAVGQMLGDDLRLVAEDRYPAMLSLKAKNYVLQRRSGEIVMRGSALRSGRDEPFGRALVAAIAKLLIEDRPQEIAELIRETIEAILERKLAPEEFARRESITSKTFSAPGNRRLARVLTERGLSVGDKVRIYQRVGGELGLLDEYAGDEDRDYLVRRVADFVARFGDLVPPDARAAAGEDRDQLSFL
jgi:DNA-binding PadR family transcriptional regulator